MVNALVRDALAGSGALVTAVDVSGPRLAHSRGLGYHARRLARNLAAMLEARRAALPDTSLYIVPDAGLGAWYTMGHVATLATRFERIVIHHHSCRYIEEHSKPIADIVSRTRGKATHVFLTKGMAEAFVLTYGAVPFHVATNARFVAQEAQRPFTRHLSARLRIGHLSNLCTDKGFFVVADTFEALRTADINAELILAGPLLEPEVEQRITRLQAAHGDRVTYLGPLSGEAKRDFYRGLELFLFPTRFRQEAAPLVVYEALSAGVPVLATDRGMIAEIIPQGAGAVCARDGDFKVFALANVADRDWSSEAVHRRGKTIKKAMAQAALCSVTEFDTLVTLLTNDSVRGVQVAST